MEKGDELRSRLTRCAGELDFAVATAINAIRIAKRSAPPDPIGAAWQKGLTDALAFLRLADEAHQRFTQWMKDVVAQEPDACGLTADERAMLLQTTRNDRSST